MKLKMRCKDCGQKVAPPSFSMRDQKSHTTPHGRVIAVEVERKSLAGAVYRKRVPRLFLCGQVPVAELVEEAKEAA